MALQLIPHCYQGLVTQMNKKTQNGQKWGGGQLPHQKTVRALLHAVPDQKPMKEGSDSLYSYEQKDSKWSKMWGQLPFQKTVRALLHAFPHWKPMKEGSDGLPSDEQKDAQWSKKGGKYPNTF